MKEEKIKSGCSMDFRIILELTEPEIKALDALAGYGTEAFLKIFYEHMGRAYLQPYEKGLTDLFDTIKKELPKHITRINNTRKAFNS